jgi:hypothetical protein
MCRFGLYLRCQEKELSVEYLLYGLPKGETERYAEVLLKTGLPSPEAADKIIALAAADGFHGFRIAKFDGSPPDFTKVVK